MHKPPHLGGGLFSTDMESFGKSDLALKLAITNSLFKGEGYVLCKAKNYALCELSVRCSSDFGVIY
jgi:hypothetical protein